MSATAKRYPAPADTPRVARRWAAAERAGLDVREVASELAKMEGARARYAAIVDAADLRSDMARVAAAMAGLSVATRLLAEQREALEQARAAHAAQLRAADDDQRRFGDLLAELRELREALALGQPQAVGLGEDFELEARIAEVRAEVGQFLR